MATAVRYPLDEAYVAGMVDADGHILINRCKQTWGQGSSTTVLVGISNAYLPVLEEIRAQWGGSIQLRKARGGGLPVHNLRFTGGSAPALLEEIRPYLRVKEAEAWLALEFLANCRKHGPGDPITVEEDALREGYYLASKYARHNRMALVGR